jgi:hypothetical protein
MVFTYRKHEVAIGVDANVTESEFALRSDRGWWALAADRVQATVGEFGVDDGTARDVVFTAAVLVNPIADVARRRSDFDRLTAR